MKASDANGYGFEFNKNALKEGVVMKLEMNIENVV